jgi:hypothetical protein
MDKMKNYEILNSPLKRPNEINFILPESSSAERSSPRLKNNLGSESSSCAVKNDPRETLLLPFMGSSRKEV